MAQHSNEEACEFIKAKCLELAQYMESEGFGYDITASVMLGLSAGWLAKTRGVEAMREGLTTAAAGVEQALQKQRAGLN